MRNIYILLFLTFSFLAKAQDEKIIMLTTIGSGPTKDVARQIALKSAIEQAFGAFISTKTELLNDKLVTDEMTSVSSGNIQSYEILSEEQLPNGNWGSTIKAKVSLSKLTSFVESKGVQVEFKGSLFAMNIKQQQLNEEGEVKAIAEMVGLLHEPMQISFDYQIKSSDPKSLDAENKNWEIPLEVTATANKNLDICAEYFIKNLQSVSLSTVDFETYKSLNKKIFPVIIKYKGEQKRFFLRKQHSINAISSLASTWHFYTRCYYIYSGIDTLYWKGKAETFEFKEKGNLAYQTDFLDSIKLSFLTSGEKVAVFKYNDKRTLQQIEQIQGYAVKSSGVLSRFVQGGFLISGPTDGTYFLGLRIDEKTNQINYLEPNSPAKLAGLKIGQKIVTVNKKEFKGMQDIRDATKICNGNSITLEFENGGSWTTSGAYTQNTLKYKIVPSYIPPYKGLVASLFDLGGYENWNLAVKDCEALNLNGFSDWRLPTNREFYFVLSSLFGRRISNFQLRGNYCTSTGDDDTIITYDAYKNFEESQNSKDYNRTPLIVRPLRIFF